MLKIRLARGGSHKRPFFRIVLTEHTKPVKSGYKEVLGWYNPMTHETQAEIDAIKKWISLGAQPSNRVAKLLLKLSGDDYFKDYIQFSDRVRKVKNAPEEEEKPAEAPAEEGKVEEVKEESPVEEKVEDTKEEVPVEEEKVEETKEEAPAEEEKTE